MSDISNICDADLHHLKPGKKVVLKSYKGNLQAWENTDPRENYWLLIGSKAIVISSDREGALISFERDLHSLGLVSGNELANSLWVCISDLKFVCRY